MIHVFRAASPALTSCMSSGCVDRPPRLAGEVVALHCLLIRESAVAPHLLTLQKGMTSATERSAILRLDPSELPSAHRSKSDSGVVKIGYEFSVW